MYHLPLRYWMSGAQGIPRKPLSAAHCGILSNTLSSILQFTISSDDITPIPVVNT